MSKKKLEDRGKTIVEYTIRSVRLPRTGKETNVPRIANMETVSMKTLIHKARECGQFHSTELIFETDFHIMMTIVKETLEKGKAVNLGGYMRLEPNLKGNVNETGKLTNANSLAIKVRALSKLKLNLTSFLWRLKGDRFKPID